MDVLSWPSKSELDEIREKVVEFYGGDREQVRFVASPYRICPLGAHIDHQGGTVSSMTINRGILLGFVPSTDSQVLLRSGQFKGEVRFRTDDVQLPVVTNYARHPNDAKDQTRSQEESNWGNYARGALYALQKSGYALTKGIFGVICGSDGLDCSGLSSSAAVGVAYLLAFENANSLHVSPTENIEYDRLIENEYLGLRNGILDQSAILLSSHGCLTYMNCKTKEYRLIQSPSTHSKHKSNNQNGYKILLAFSGLKLALTTNPGYNRRVAECQEAASFLLQAGGYEEVEPILSNVELAVYETYKGQLQPSLAKRAAHYFSENRRVRKGLEAWASGNMQEFGKLVSESGLSSIQNYECGCEPLIQLYEILMRAPGVYGARFSGAGFRGCCVAIVDADRAQEAAAYVKTEYSKLQPLLASQMDPKRAVIICDTGDCARVI